MSDYIERKAACAYKPPEKMERRYRTYNLDDAFEDGYDEHIKQVEAIPAADVVDIVRCRDCKHYNMYGCAKGFGWCHLHGIGHASIDNWFCAGGERVGGDK